MMKLQFRHQLFQADAANAVCDVFAGQPFHAPTYMIDPGAKEAQMELFETQFTGFNNAPIVISHDTILEHIRNIQRKSGIKPSDSLAGKYNLTVEMETGVGKTYTYIKTMYELYKRYGWSKYIIVVPSVAIREGVYKSLQVTEEHFAEDYGKKIRYFIYNSAQLTEIDRFASDSEINVMIINSQAFNARGKDARRIYMKLDEFRSRRPIDILAKTNPILIIDEPQSVEGAATKERLKEFNPLMTLRYSATHKTDSIYNMIYRLDAIEAYNQRLVKKIAVKGISVTGSTATEGYIYIQSINLSKGNPTATIEFDIKGKTGVRKVVRVVNEGYNLYENSGELAEYKDGYTVLRIDGRDSSVEFTNGVKLFAGDVVGSVSEKQLRRIQIRETILSHIERERQLFAKGVKVLSLFFIDEVAMYKQYDAAGNAQGGTYAEIFEDEYKNIVEGMQLELSDTPEYLAYLEGIAVERTHAGYFSIDKKSGRIVDSKLGDKKERTSDDADAYDLIMKDKERLLNRSEPVRFIFSHSALREGWDNPNVFQICTLKQSGSDVRKRQEVGRGLRLSVNQGGERMDENILSRDEIHNVNMLTVIANESYDSFAKSLQSEIAEAVADRPVKVEAKLFKDKFGDEVAFAINHSLIVNGYVNSRGELTEKYYEDKKNGTVAIPEEAEGRVADVIAVLDSVYDPNTTKPEDARKNTVDVTLDKSKLDSKAFRELWSRINGKSYYTVNFDENELAKNAINALNIRLRVSKVFFKVEQGEQAKDMESKEQLQSGEGFVKKQIVREDASNKIRASSSVRYDLVGKIVADTGLTRKAVAAILAGIEKPVFEQFGDNPEEFIIRAANLINEQKATVIIEHITYDKLTTTYNTDIFTQPGLKKGKLGVNALESKRSLYDYVIYDSDTEHNLAVALESHPEEVEVYVKLPKGFYINTPVGKYNPDWAIAFYEGKVKHIYFVAETKGNMDTMELRNMEIAKAHCAREHFRAISGDNVIYDVIDSYDTLWDLVRP